MNRKIWTIEVVPEGTSDSSCEKIPWEATGAVCESPSQMANNLPAKELAYKLLLCHSFQIISIEQSCRRTAYLRHCVEFRNLENIEKV